MFLITWITISTIKFIDGFWKLKTMSELIPIDDLINEKATESRYMIDNLLLVNTTVIFVAVIKVGKTTLVLQFLISIVNKEKFLDLKESNYHVDTIIFFQ